MLYGVTHDLELVVPPPDAAARAGLAARPVHALLGRALEGFLPEPRGLLRVHLPGGLIKLAISASPSSVAEADSRRRSARPGRFGRRYWRAHRRTTARTFARPQRWNFACSSAAGMPPRRCPVAGRQTCAVFAPAGER